jgi:hypothetical protein
MNPFQTQGVRLQWPSVDAIEIGNQFHQLRDCFSLQVKLRTNLLYLDFKLFCAHCESSIGPSIGHFAKADSRPHLGAPCADVKHWPATDALCHPRAYSRRSDRHQAWQTELLAY